MSSCGSGCGLVRLIEKTAQNPVSTDFADTLLGPATVSIPGTTPGMDSQRFRKKVFAHLKKHEDHVALQRLRRDRQLTTNGVMEPRRLFESPYTDRAPTGPDYLFPDADVDVIVDILHAVKTHAVPDPAA